LGISYDLSSNLIRPDFHRGGIPTQKQHDVVVANHASEQ
jgi:hypothetical protein